MKRSTLFVVFLSVSLCSWSQTVVFEMQVGEEGKGLDAFVVNNSQAFEVEVIDPPPGFSTLGLELGSDTGGIWLDDFYGTDYQADVVWLDVGQWESEVSDGDADGILTARGQSNTTHIRSEANAGYNVEREKDSSGTPGRGSLKLVGFFGDGTTNTEIDLRWKNDGTVPTWQGQSLRVHGSQIMVTAWEPPADGNVPPALDIDFSTPNTVVLWDDMFKEGYTGISWASGLAQVVYYRVTDLSDVPAPTPPPPPTGIEIEGESAEVLNWAGEQGEIILKGTDTKTEGDPGVIVFPAATDPSSDGVTDITFMGEYWDEDELGVDEWAVYRFNATAEQAGGYTAHIVGRNVGDDNCLIVLRTNPTDPTASPREGADGVALFQQETYLMRTGEFAGLLPVKEGENVLTVTSWDNGFLIDKIILERSDFSAALISSDWPPRGSDADVIYRLENEFGMKVNFTEDEVIANSDPPVRAVYTPEALNAANIRLLVISATIDSGNVADHYLDADIPILFMEQAIFDDMLMGDSGANFDNDLREWSIVDNTHPITEGLPQDSVAVQFSEKDMLPGEMAYVTDTGAEGVSVLATSPDDPAQVTLAAIDEGGLLSDGSPAPNRRVFMGFADWNFGSDVANETTWEIFDAAVTWLLGGEEVPVEDWSLY